MSEELKQFDINIDDIKESNNLFDNIYEAIEKMKLHTLTNKFEVVLNNNLIESKEKATNYRTIFGCRISYENLDKNISFIVREDTKPSYEELQHQLEQYKNIIKEVRECINEGLCQCGERELRDLVNGYELLEILDKVGD